MSTDQNKAVVRRINNELISQGKMEVADELFASSFVDHSAFPGVPPPGTGSSSSSPYSGLPSPTSRSPSRIRSPRETRLSPARPFMAPSVAT